MIYYNKNRFRIPWNNNRSKKGAIMAKALVFTGGEWIIAEITEQDDPNNIYLKTENGREIYVQKDNAIILDKDYPSWGEVAQFLAGTIGETLTLGDDSVKAYRMAQSLATRILGTRGVTITAHLATA